ncbi:TPA: helix-turn-helix domain-containing protein [Pasteurella multocida]|uniref:Helix-turn-helix domain-containing protein n=1 Tax=Pasteurella oralis TaxID=1071947 RepID=A0ABW4NWC3_9PAST|nr:helix-turn-helix transcriptional regulator [Pasteurella multocida]
MALTEFGKAIRKARIDSGDTLRSMSKALNITQAFLHSIETGKKKIPIRLVGDIALFFAKHDIYIPNLPVLADLSNQYVDLKTLSDRHKILVIKLVHNNYTDDELKKLEEII